MARSRTRFHLPGLQKLSALARAGFFGRVTGFRLDFGWWVFDGGERPSQRPSWNYRRSGGGGLTLDMYPHWRYVIEGILGPIRRVTTAAATAVPERVDEAGKPFRVDVDDTSITLGRAGERRGRHHRVLLGDARAPRRPFDHADRRHRRLGDCRIASLLGAERGRNPDRAPLQSRRSTSAPIIAPTGRKCPARGNYTNPYRVGWEHFLRHVAADAPLTSDLAAGIRDVQLAEACYRSAAEGKWIALDDAAG